MWSRQELKGNARVLMRANYLKVLVVGFILSLLVGSGYNSARNAARENDVDFSVTDLLSAHMGLFVGMLIGIAGIIIVSLLINALLSIFL